MNTWRNIIIMNKIITTKYTNGLCFSLHDLHMSICYSTDQPRGWYHDIDPTAALITYRHTKEFIVIEFNFNLHGDICTLIQWTVIQHDFQNVSKIVICILSTHSSIIPCYILSCIMCGVNQLKKFFVVLFTASHADPRRHYAIAICRLFAPEL